MGMKSKSGHFSGGGAGGPSKRRGGSKYKMSSKLAARMPKHKAQINHIMANRPGHLPNTKANRQILEKLSRDKRYYIKKDSNGNKIYSKVSNGKEYWVYVRNGIIQNGGANTDVFRFHKKGDK